MTTCPRFLPFVACGCKVVAADTVQYCNCRCVASLLPLLLLILSVIDCGSVNPLFDYDDTVTLSTVLYSNGRLIHLAQGIRINDVTQNQLRYCTVLRTVLYSRADTAAAASSRYFHRHVNMTGKYRSEQSTYF
jgi:hypothetical protein